MGSRFATRAWARAALISALALISCLALSPGRPFPPESVAAEPVPVLGPACGKAAIDGRIDPAEWGAAPVLQVTFVPGGQAEPLTGSVRVMNGAKYLYLAISIADDELSPLGQYLIGGDQFRIDFDNDHGGALFHVGDDVLSVHTVAPRFRDSHITGGNSTASSTYDEEAGGTDDGTGGAGRQGGMNHFELRHPLCSGDVLDFCLGPGDVVGIRLEYLDAEADESFGGSRYYPGYLDTSLFDIRVGACGQVADADLYLPKLLRSP